MLKKIKRVFCAVVMYCVFGFTARESEVGGGKVSSMFRKELWEAGLLRCVKLWLIMTFLNF